MDLDLFPVNSLWNTTVKAVTFIRKTSNDTPFHEYQSKTVLFLLVQM